MRELGIGELSRRTGVASSALRFYEAEGILSPAYRQGGRRRYDERAIRVVEVICAAQDSGFTLKEIALLFRGVSEGSPLSAAWRRLAVRKLEELDALERRARSMKATLKAGLECGCLRLEDCRLVATSRRAPGRHAESAGKQ